MKVYLIRHGESEANAKHMHAGWSSTPLTAVGEAQALAVRPLLHDLKLDKIYVSDLPRARRTAELIFGNRQMIYTPMLREINMEKISGMTFSQLSEIYGEEYLACREKWDFSPFGCESVPDFLLRIDAFFDELEREEKSDSSIAVVAHAGVVRAAARRVVDVKFNDRYSLKIDNASLCVLSFDTEKRWRIEHWNYTPSLD